MAGRDRKTTNGVPHAVEREEEEEKRRRASTPSLPLRSPTSFFLPGTRALMQSNCGIK